MTIRQMVREQIAQALESDLTGGETILKEVWEQLEGDDDLKDAELEVQKIIDWLRR